MLRMTAALLAAIVIACAAVPPAVAEETGLAGIHEQRREGSRICMSSHFHYGSSSGQPARKAAEAAAARDWAGFTALEYGLAWASYNLAGSKGMKCSQEGRNWACQAEARPCKRYRRR